MWKVVQSPEEEAGHFYAHTLCGKEPHTYVPAVRPGDTERTITTSPFQRKKRPREMLSRPSQSISYWMVLIDVSVSSRLTRGTPDCSGSFPLHVGLSCACCKDNLITVLGPYMYTHCISWF